MHAVYAVIQIYSNICWQMNHKHKQMERYSKKEYSFVRVMAIQKSSRLGKLDCITKIGRKCMNLYIVVYIMAFPQLLRNVIPKCWIHPVLMPERKLLIKRHGREWQVLTHQQTYLNGRAPGGKSVIPLSPKLFNRNVFGNVIENFIMIYPLWHGNYIL